MLNSFLDVVNSSSLTAKSESTICDMCDEEDAQEVNAKVCMLVITGCHSIYKPHP